MICKLMSIAGAATLQVRLSMDRRVVRPSTWLIRPATWYDKINVIFTSYSTICLAPDLYEFQRRTNNDRISGVSNGEIL